MQDTNALSGTFLHRTDLLAVRLRINVQDLPKYLGIARRTLFSGRTSDSVVSTKTWLKLTQLEAEVAERVKSDVANAALETRASRYFTGPEIFFLRNSARMSAPAIADHLGLSVEDYSAIERGDAPLPSDPGFSQKVADALGLSTSFPKEAGDKSGPPQLKHWTPLVEACVLLGAGDGGKVLTMAKDLLRKYEADPSEISSLIEAKNLLAYLVKERQGASMKDVLFEMIKAMRWGFVKAGGADEAWEETFKAMLEEYVASLPEGSNQ